MWKQTNVNAIFKQGEKTETYTRKYRPISLPSLRQSLVKLIIKIRDALIQHMTQNNLFPASQRGFMRGNSYTAQFLEFSDEVSQALDEGDDVGVRW